jgi:ribonuclease HI
MGKPKHVSVRPKNPHAVYINCDGAMDYDAHNSGGIGFIVSFPDNLGLEDISISRGQYVGGNIERIEYEALIQALLYALDLFERESAKLTNVRQLILVTDRFALQDADRTNAYKIAAWRNNKWQNYEGKPIKNHELLNKLDKTRSKLSKCYRLRVSIEYRPRNQNRAADKLAKAAKKEGLPLYNLAKKGEKIGKRRFNGSELNYRRLRVGQFLNVHIFRKDPVQELWEVSGEVTKGVFIGQKLKIYADNATAAILKRGNLFEVQLKAVKTNFITIEQPQESSPTNAGETN